MQISVSVENLSKAYHIGQIGTGTFANDLRLWWAKMRGKPNPFLRIGDATDGNRDGETIWALKDVSFTVKQGEVLGIIGRNGAGKSTLLKILSRVTAPTSGRIRVKGRVASLLEVGTGFHQELTGRENIYLNGAILGMDRREIVRKFDQIVSFSGVEKFIDTPVKRYSSGMYVRLAFAVAAHLEPEILVVDEVLAVGDAAFQRKCLGKMEEVSKEGRTVLFVSHNMAAVTGLTSRCVYLRAGAISTIGITGKVVDTYLAETASQSQQREGYADLRVVYRGSPIVNPVAQLQWARILDDEEQEKSRFIRGRPFAIEAGFCLTKNERQLQFGFGVRHVQTGADVFVSPSPIYEEEALPGNYSIRMFVDPNVLRPGSYSVILKMFCRGVRQETIGDILFFDVVEDPAIVRQDVFSERWISGLVKMESRWNLERA